MRRSGRLSALLFLVACLTTTLLPAATALKPRAHGECLSARRLRDSGKSTFPREFFIEAPVEEEDSQHVKVMGVANSNRASSKCSERVRNQGNDPGGNNGGNVADWQLASSGGSTLL